MIDEVGSDRGPATDSSAGQALRLDLWPSNLPLIAPDRIEAGLVVLSQSGSIEGRTTGARLRCYVPDCPGWFIGVKWETGQGMLACSQGWRYVPEMRIVRIAGGGEISARVISPTPLGVAPRDPREWPARADLSGAAGWHVGPEEDYRSANLSGWKPSTLDQYGLDQVLVALDEIADTGLAQKWAGKKSRVSIEAVPPWLADWISDRDPARTTIGRIGRSWHPWAPESWCLHLRIIKNFEGSHQSTIYRDDGWVHPELPPTVWPELTRRIWSGATVTDAVAALLAEPSTVSQ